MNNKINNINVETLTLPLPADTQPAGSPPKTSQCYLASPAGTAHRGPGILVIHEFWGLTDNIKNKTRRLAELGYTALAVDFYGNGWLAGTAKEASSAMQKVFSDPKKMSAQVSAFWETLKTLKQVDESKTASIGFCMGGALSLHLARMGAAVKGVVSFHGNLACHHKPAPGGIQAKILVLNGEADPFITSEQIQNFKTEMQSAKADYRFINYPGALHGFTNPLATENGQKFNIPTAYSKETDQASWEEMLTFFKQIF